MANELIPAGRTQYSLIVADNRAQSFNPPKTILWTERIALTSSVTIRSPIEVQGGSLFASASMTMTIRLLSCPRVQFLFGSASLSLETDHKQPSFFPEWFGAKGDARQPGGTFTLASGSTSLSGHTFGPFISGSHVNTPCVIFTQVESTTGSAFIPDHTTDQIVHNSADIESFTACKLTTTNTLPAGLNTTSTYWTRRITDNTSTLYPTLADAVAGTNQSLFTDNGTGAHSIIAERLDYHTTTLTATSTTAATLATAPSLKYTGTGIIAFGSDDSDAIHAALAASRGLVPLSFAPNKMYGIARGISLASGSLTYTPGFEMNGAVLVALAKINNGMLNNDPDDSANHNLGGLGAVWLKDGRFNCNNVALEGVRFLRRSRVASASSTSTTILDTGATFIGWGVREGDEVYNHSENVTCRVTAVNSDTQLTVTAGATSWASDRYSTSRTIADSPSNGATAHQIETIIVYCPRWGGISDSRQEALMSKCLVLYPGALGFDLVSCNASTYVMCSSQVGRRIGQASWRVDSKSGIGSGGCQLIGCTGGDGHRFANYPGANGFDITDAGGTGDGSVVRISGGWTEGVYYSFYVDREGTIIEGGNFTGAAPYPAYFTKNSGGSQMRDATVGAFTNLNSYIETGAQSMDGIGPNFNSTTNALYAPITQGWTSEKPYKRYDYVAKGKLGAHVLEPGTYKHTTQNVPVVALEVGEGSAQVAGGIIADQGSLRSIFGGVGITQNILKDPCDLSTTNWTGGRGTSTALTSNAKRSADGQTTADRLRCRGRTATAGSNSTTLVDSTATFTTWAVQIGDKIYNYTEGVSATVVTVDSQTQLTTTAVTDWTNDEYIVYRPGFISALSANWFQWQQPDIALINGFKSTGGYDGFVVTSTASDTISTTREFDHLTKVRVASVSGLPIGLAAGTDYYLSRVSTSQNSYKLCTTEANAINGVAVDLTDNGGGLIFTVDSTVFTADATSDTIVHNTFDYPNYTQVRLLSSGTLPAPLTSGTTYWTGRQTTTSSKLATSYDNAIATSYINITDAGTGTHIVIPNIIRHASADLPSYTRVRLVSSTSLPQNLAAATDYWTVRITSASSKLATSYNDALHAALLQGSNANHATTITLLSEGTGSHSLYSNNIFPQDGENYIFSARLSSALSGTAFTNPTFTANASLDTITYSGIDVAPYTKVYVSTSNTLPAGLAASTAYYTIRTSSTGSKLARTLAEASSSTGIDITSTGTGTHTLILSNATQLYDVAGKFLLYGVAPGFEIRNVTEGKTGYIAEVQHDNQLIIGWSADSNISDWNGDSYIAPVKLRLSMSPGNGSTFAVGTPAIVDWQERTYSTYGNSTSSDNTRTTIRSLIGTTATGEPFDIYVHGTQLEQRKQGQANIPGPFIDSPPGSQTIFQLPGVAATYGAGQRIWLKLPISFATADAATLFTVPAKYQRLEIVDAWWENVAAWAGGTASAVGISTSNTNYNTKGDILGGRTGDTTSTMTAGMVPGTRGTKFFTTERSGTPLNYATTTDAASSSVTTETLIGRSPTALPSGHIFWLTPTTSLLADNTNYATITLLKRTAGAASSSIGSINTKTSGSGGTDNWTAYNPIAITTTTHVSEGDVVTFDITKAAAGVIVPASRINSGRETLKRIVLTTGDTIRFDRITSAFTQGSGFAWIECRVLG